MASISLQSRLTKFHFYTGNEIGKLHNLMRLVWSVLTWLRTQRPRKNVYIFYIRLEDSITEQVNN